MRIMTGIMLTILLCSLGYAQHLVKIDASAAFFLLPSRLWELLIGTLIAFYFLNRKKLLPLKINQLVSLLGLFLIAYATFKFNKETPFPSLFTLMPTLGAGFIILCATEDTFTCIFKTYSSWQSTFIRNDSPYSFVFFHGFFNLEIYRKPI